jgi:ABC-type tungstate transport system permease subunit
MSITRNKCPNVKEDDSNKFINWLLSEKGRLKISEFKIDGKKLFLCRQIKVIQYKLFIERNKNGKRI